jgi:ATPase subunit of ABC transporter with duplicated ATPase domains
MITVSNVSLVFSDKKLFEDVNLKFLPGNCYGIIGANGAGKSTLLKIISGEKEPSSGQVIIEKNKRLAFLRQDHNAYRENTVLETVIMGHKRLYDIMKAKDVLYSKGDISEEEGYQLADLEYEFAELEGWDAESNAEKLLYGLNVPKEDFDKTMEDIIPKHRVKVLLAQALFGNPDILLLDEPTNDLDFEAITWLETFLSDYPNTVITVSHDRHFLNNICSHMVDIDYSQAKMFTGNYDFWMESSQLVQRLMADKNKKKEERIAELKAFIMRFSANLSKSSQATSRKKALEKIQLDEILPSTRKYPFIGFDIERPLGKDVLEVDKLSLVVNGVTMFENVSFTMNRGDKVALFSRNDLAKTMLLRVLSGELEPTSGTYKWGNTVNQSYFPADHDYLFNQNTSNLIEWLRPYSKEPADSYIRGFLGRMLFSGDQPLKQVKHLSGGEKMRCMYAKLMLSNANTMLIDAPTNHLDLEAIQAVNRGFEDFTGSLIMSSVDLKLISTVCNKVIEVCDLGAIEFNGPVEEYIIHPDFKLKAEALYNK